MNLSAGQILAHTENSFPWKSNYLSFVSSITPTSLHTLGDSHFKFKGHDVVQIM